MSSNILYFTPRKFRHKKVHRKVGIASSLRPICYAAIFKSFSTFVISKDFGLFYGHHIEFLRRLIKRRVYERYDLIIRRFSLCKPITQKPLQARMGKGYGKLTTWVGFVRPGSVLFEITSRQKVEMDMQNLNLIFTNFFKKIPFPIKLVFIKKFAWFKKSSKIPQVSFMQALQPMFKRKTRKSYRRIKKVFKRRRKLFRFNRKYR